MIQRLSDGSIEDLGAFLQWAADGVPVHLEKDVLGREIKSRMGLKSLLQPGDTRTFGRHI